MGRAAGGVCRIAVCAVLLLAAAPAVAQADQFPPNTSSATALDCDHESTPDAGTDDHEISECFSLKAPAGTADEPDKVLAGGLTGLGAFGMFLGGSMIAADVAAGSITTLVVIGGAAIAFPVVLGGLAIAGAGALLLGAAAGTPLHPPHSSHAIAPPRPGAVGVGQPTADRCHGAHRGKCASLVRASRRYFAAFEQALGDLVAVAVAQNRFATAKADGVQGAMIAQAAAVKVGNAAEIRSLTALHAEGLRFA